MKRSFSLAGFSVFDEQCSARNGAGFPGYSTRPRPLASPLVAGFLHRAPRSLLCSRAAFTLIEMLIVIAIIAVLSAFTLPALQGLLGTSGVRGGVNTVLATLDRARAAAIENRTDVYVGFPPATFTDPADPNTGFAAMIVIRGATYDETPGTFLPLSRWVRLPPGVVFQTTNMTLAALTNATNLPRLANSKVAPVFLRYDRFGRIRTPGSNITVGEGMVNGGKVDWKGNNRETLTAQRLTGRWTATRP